MEDTSDLEKTLEYRPAASVRPFAVDPRTARSPWTLRLGARRWPLPSGSIAIALLAALAFVGALVVRFGTAPPPGPPRAASFTRGSPGAAPSPAAVSTVDHVASSGVPTVDVASLPRPPIGTVIGAPKHRLWIDGRLAPSWKRTVKCGVHVVRVGSQGEEREIDVPCGGEISVAP